ncbi:MAG: dehydrogenase [Planctomycetes bacterium]|nr:dehydrogenase [Planctomycetota bacterium]MCB9905932.1 dehydrogenase [Planctomycetota bacterium]
MRDAILTRLLAVPSCVPRTGRAFTAACLVAGLGSATAQNGDRPGEAQPPLPEDLAIPAAPVLSPEEARAAFVLEPGLAITCIASEPLVVDPVDVAFDGDGRLWVCEMRGYMPNVDGEGETEPNGRVAVLRDEDGDGVMDARTDFLTGLVLPRAVMPYRDGALVIVPPELRFYRDTDGDGRADEHVVVDRGFGGIHSPEHAANALRWTHDNWIQLSNHRWRYREVDGEWQRQRTNGGGQWGLTLDAEGRAFFNTNSDGLRGDEYSSHYAVRNPNYGVARGVNVRVAQEQAVWPIRMTPGVNRGYRPETLRDDWTLATFTGACGPLVYLGDALPREYRGNAFVAEPCGNLVKRYELREKGALGVEALDPHPGREFLASTDERFRPVNLVDGPDGALYVVDMYRGVIQHRLFVTSWLRAQVEARGLEQPLGLGRIWRIAPADEERAKPAPMSAMSWTELVATLGHPNGWRRVTAQRLIVEEGRSERDARELCRLALQESKSTLGRMHALWALEGLDALDAEDVIAGLSDPDEPVHHAAVRCAETPLSTGDDDVLAALADLEGGVSDRVRRQVVLSLGQAEAAAADRALLRTLSGSTEAPELVGAALSGLRGREPAILAPALELGERPGPNRLRFLEGLAASIARSGQSEAIAAVLERVVDDSSRVEAARALVDGLLAGRPRGATGEPVALRLAVRPGAQDALEDEQRLAALRGRLGADRVDALLSAITWPGGPNDDGAEVRALTDAEQERFDRGRALFADSCASCHQSSGLGEPGLAPPLRYSPWLLGGRKRPIRILLGGLTGPVTVAGEEWNLEMPVFAASPEDVAAVLTYARREWGHGADPITPEEVCAVQAELAERGKPWTAAELEAAGD